MRVSIINLNMVAQDAIGQCMLNQTRFFRRRGDEVKIYLAHPPQGLPTNITTLAMGADGLLAGRDEHFASSNLYIYHYPGRYPFIESIKTIDRGAVIFYYHNVTPPELWGSDSDRHLLVEGQQGVAELTPFADILVTDSPYNATELVEKYGCEADRVRTLPLAVLLDQFNPGPKEHMLIKKYNLFGRKVILFVGRMAGNKRVDLLIEALPLVQQHVPNATLMLVGDHQGNLAIQEVVSRAKARAIELGVINDVIFTGSVNTLPPYYRLADVYATASLHEGFGVPLIEAMASGLPIVASRVTTHPWVIGEAGLLAEPENVADLAAKLVQVLTDDQLCGNLVQHGLTRARQFSLEQYEENWARIINEATAWLPNQPYPRLRSLTTQTDNAPINTSEIPKERTIAIAPEILLASGLKELESTADVMIRGYVVRSKMPIFGPLIAWLRRNLTSHLREPYLDPMLERQVSFNWRVIGWLKYIQNVWSTMLAKERHQTDSRFQALENEIKELREQIAELKKQQ